ncbi:MAG: penicillin-binding transpeptidase domain-containing protein [Bacteriovorax sp.]
MTTFLQINVLLVITYFIFFIAQKIEASLAETSSPKAFLRCVQLLIILSIITPPLLKFIPVKGVSIDAPTFVVEEKTRNEYFKETKKKIYTFMEKAPANYKKIERSIDFDFKFIFLSFWCLGFVFFIGRFAHNYFSLSKALFGATILKKMGKLKIVIAEDIMIPFSVRTFRTYWVAIPIDLLNSKSDLQIAIKHEVQHHRQKDTSWAIVIELLVCVFYFNPVIYLWKNTIIEYQEFSCDEALTGQKDVLSHDYGNCLLRVAETALKNRQMYAGTTSMAVVFKDSKYFKTFLLRRIEMIVKEKRSTSKWIPICTGLLIAVFTVTVAYGVEKVVRAKSRSINGGTLVVDNDVQKIADEALARAVKGTRFTAGFIIVADPMTGKILAVANVDTKHVKKGHWALAELIEPASFAKTFVIAEAIEKKATDTNEVHRCENGHYKYKGKLYRDWKSSGWKELTTAETLALSSDICSIKIGEKVGKKSLEEMVVNFGFGEEGTAKDFPEARIGDGPEVGEQFIPKVALGYAFRSSPIEIMQAFGAIANGGNLMKPIMANAQNPEIIRRVLSSENAQKMKTLLQGVVLSGTGKGKERAESSFYTTAGKTASARLNDYMNIDWYGGERPNFAGFVGFAPINNPRVQVFVGLIDPDADRAKSGAHGGEHAAPVFKEVAENVLAYLKVAPDKF